MREDIELTGAAASPCMAAPGLRPSRWGGGGGVCACRDSRGPR